MYFSCRPPSYKGRSNWPRPCLHASPSTSWTVLLSSRMVQWSERSVFSVVGGSWGRACCMPSRARLTTATFWLSTLIRNGDGSGCLITRGNRPCGCFRWDFAVVRVFFEVGCWRFGAMLRNGSFGVMSWNGV